MKSFLFKELLCNSRSADLGLRAKDGLPGTVWQGRAPRVILTLERYLTIVKPTQGSLAKQAERIPPH
jgi:hypothetical protein